MASPITTTICCIARNEEDYLHEWISYHLYLGFDYIQIHDNSSDNSLKGLNGQYDGRVEIVHFPGDVMQYPAYNDLVKRSKDRFTFAAFIDVDEFFVLKNSSTISEFLSKREISAGIAVNWVLFGSNFREKKENKPVLVRFVRRQRGVNRLVKSIVRLSCIEEYNLSHCPTKYSGAISDPKGNTVVGPYNDFGDDSEISLFHFFFKSKEEFLIKGSRLRPSVNQNRTSSLDDFFEYNSFCNEVLDCSALEFHLKHSGGDLNRIEEIERIEQSPDRQQVIDQVSWCRRSKSSIADMFKDRLQKCESTGEGLAKEREFHQERAAAVWAQKLILQGEIDSLRSELSHLQKVVDSAHKWQHRSWFKRAFRKWQGPKKTSYSTR